MNSRSMSGVGLHEPQVAIKSFQTALGIEELLIFKGVASIVRSSLQVNRVRGKPGRKDAQPLATKKGDPHNPVKTGSGKKRSASANSDPGSPRNSNDLKTIEIEKHRQLVGNQREIFQRINTNPELSKLFFINPAMALKELGINLSPDMTHHVLGAVRHPPGLLTRRHELEQKLKEALNDEPQPNKPEWLSEVLFKRLKLTPLDTSNQEPKYLEPLNAEIVRHLQSKRPKLRKRATGRRPLSGTVLGVATWRPAVRRLDLNAKLPQLNTQKQTPSAINLEELYFYKDSHPLAHDLLELGIIQRRGFPIHSGDSFRKIKKGEKRNAFNTWVKQVRFSEKPKK